jgi:hypothetical protein
MDELKTRTQENDSLDFFPAKNDMGQLEINPAEKFLGAE